MKKIESDIILENEKFLCRNVEFTLLNNLVKDVIIGLKALKQHRSITLDFDGKNKPLNFKREGERHLYVMCSNVKFPTLFPGIDQNTEHIKMPSFINWYSGFHWIKMVTPNATFTNPFFFQKTIGWLICKLHNQKRTLINLP